MSYLLIKAVLSGIIVAVVSEVSKRNPAFGALIVSLPLVSLMSMIWLWQETRDESRIAAHAEATFWYVLPSLPTFLLMLVLLRRGFPFWPALLLGCLLTAVLYAAMVNIAPRLGIKL
jgi:hypothetical protein